MESLRKEIDDARDGESEKLNQIRKKYEEQVNDLDNLLQKAKKEKKRCWKIFTKNGKRRKRKSKKNSKLRKIKR